MKPGRKYHNSNPLIEGLKNNLLVAIFTTLFKAVKKLFRNKR
jgi:hypothetical protein